MADIEFSEWARVNRAPVWPGAWNRWQILTNQLPEDATPEDVARAVISIMSIWCGGMVERSRLEPGLMWSGTRPTGAASDLVLRDYGSYADVPDLTMSADGLLLTARQRDAGAQRDRMRLPGPVQELAPASNIAKVQIGFVWRSPAETIPWPVWRDGVLVGNLDPLAKKDWVLDRVLEATMGAPAESTLLDSILMPPAEAASAQTDAVANAASEAAVQVAQNAEAAARWGLGGALLLFGAGVAVWIGLRSKR